MICWIDGGNTRLNAFQHHGLEAAGSVVDLLKKQRSFRSEDLATVNPAIMITVYPERMATHRQVLSECGVPGQR